ncbi:MAG: Holliday junction branch migration DNA helicase RuvB [SAR202 cluster bacterium]|nr:Holliday junction branch migration DNA helicase RuvB [SAR202 cluster bacterium]
MTERVVSGIQQENDSQIDYTLRPKSLKDYIGQTKIVDNLKISIVASKQRNEPLDHTLLYGPPGLGKTTLSTILANEMESPIKITSGPAIERAGDMVSILTRLQKGEILFIDEIHRLNRTVEEILYSAMEDFVVSWMIDKGLKARSMNLPIQPFTLVGATTRFGMVSSPLRDRFGSVYRLNFYDNKSMEMIVKRSIAITNIEADTKGIVEIAKRSRGTPRIANRILRRVRDYAQVKANNKITGIVANEALTKLEVDEIGLDNNDRLLLKSIISNFKGGPVGIDTLATSISEESETIEDVYEPYLIQIGFLERTKKGRIVTEKTYKHLNIKSPKKNSSDQVSLF